VVKDCAKPFRRKHSYNIDENRGQGKRSPETTEGHSPSTRSQTSGTPSPNYASLQNKTVHQYRPLENPPKPLHNARALISTTSERASSEHILEVLPQLLINDFLGIHLSIPHPISSFWNSFNFFLNG
jgi:hypothetical protein